jgi:hypothetical protein
MHGRRTAMLIRGSSISVAGVLLAASAAVAGGLTDRLQTERMTVLEVSTNRGQFLCVEHKRWTFVPNDELRLLGTGDIVKIQHNGQVHEVIKVRGASEELASPEL